MELSLFYPTSQSIGQTLKLNKDKILRILPRYRRCTLPIVKTAFLNFILELLFKNENEPAYISDGQWMQK